MWFTIRKLLKAFNLQWVSQYIIYTVLSNSFLYILIWWNVPVCNELRSKPIHLKLLLPHIRISNYTVLPFTEDFNFKLENRVYFSSSSMVQWSVPAMELSANFLDSDFLSALNPCRLPFFSFCLVEYFHQQLLVLSDSTGIILGYPYWNIETDILRILKYNSQRGRDQVVKRKTTRNDF